MKNQKENIVCCEECGIKIPAERLKILPHTKRCVNHSEEKPKLVDDIVIVVDSNE